MNDATSDLLILARALQFGAGMTLVTVAAFRAFVLLPGFAGESDATRQGLVPYLRRLWKISIFALATHLVSGLFLFWAVAAGMSGSSLSDALNLNTLSTVLFQTRFGTVCLWRAAFLVLFLFVLPVRPWTLRHRLSLPEIAAGLLAAALFISIAWTGHAATSSGTWNLAADALHLLAASIWPGGLLPFALFLSFAGHDLMASHFVPVMKTALRFSAMSFTAVFVLAASGIVNAFFLVGSFSALIATPYGQVLCLKLLLFSGMLVIASWNRWRLLPRLLYSGGESADARPLLRRLRNFVLAELSLAIAVIFVVALLGTLPPPR